MLYFSYTNHSYIPKNNLEKEVQAFLKTKSRQIIHRNGIVKFKEDVVAGIKNINANNPRCKPINPYFWKTGVTNEHDDWKLELPGICCYVIYSGTLDS